MYLIHHTHLGTVEITETTAGYHLASRSIYYDIEIGPEEKIYLFPFDTFGTTKGIIPAIEETFGYIAEFNSASPGRPCICLPASARMLFDLIN